MNLREDISKFSNIARIPGPSQRLHANQVPSELGIPNALYSTFRPSELVDNDVIDIKCMQKIKIYYAKIIREYGSSKRDLSTIIFQRPFIAPVSQRT